MYSLPLLITLLTTTGPLLTAMGPPLPELAEPNNYPDFDIVVKFLRSVLPKLFNLRLKPEGEQLPAAQWLHQIRVSATLCRK
jgi:hypothetical protein